MRGLRLVLPGAGLATALLFLVPPETSRLYPRCLFQQATGLLCPGCGATRALAALLHGHVGEAFHRNALIVTLLPLAAMYLAVALRRRSWPPIPVSVTSTLLAASLLFTLLRNLP